MAIQSIGRGATVVATANGLQQYEQTFITSGTWQKPTGVKTVEVTCVGGGGGAAGSSSGYPGAGGGYIKRIVDVSSITSASVVVGAGGVSGSSFGSKGGTSSFGNIVYSYGGEAWNQSFSAKNHNGTGQPGVSESLQHQMGGVANLVWSELVYANLAGVSTTPIPGGNNRYGNNKIAYGNGTFVVVSGQRDVWTSTDGNTWVQRSAVLPSGFTGERVAFGNGVFVTVSTTSGVAAAYSSDGITWTSASLPTSQAWTGVTFGNGVFLAYANGLTPAATSTNGATWTTTTLPGNSGINTVFVNGYFIMDYYRSTNGTSWTVTNAPSTFSYIAYGNNTYVATLNSPTSTTYYYSSDGTNWNSSSFISSPTSTSTGVYSPIIFVYDRFVRSSSYGTMSTNYIYGNTHFFTSIDGINWTYQRSKSNYASSYAQATGPAIHSVSDALPGANSAQVTMLMYSFGVDSSAIAYNGGGIYKVSNYFSPVHQTMLYVNNNSNFSNYFRNHQQISAPGSHGRADRFLFTNSSYQALASTPFTDAMHRNGPGSPEGYCAGGKSIYYIPSPDTIFINQQTPYYGCGADTFYNNPMTNGGQGIVILRWWV